MSKTLYSVYRYIVLGLFLIINIWLFLLSIFSTSRLTADASERTYYTGDHVWLHIIILVVLIAAVFYLVRNNIFTRINSYLSNNEKTFIRIRNICLIIIGISGAAWVLLTQSNAGADQYYVLDAARGLRNGDYSAFRYNGYISKYTNQIGLLFIEYIIGFIVGDYNYLFWQLLNVVMIVFTYKMFSDILGILKLPRIACPLLYWEFCFSHGLSTAYSYMAMLQDYSLPLPLSNTQCFLLTALKNLMALRFHILL